MSVSDRADDPDTPAPAVSVIVPVRNAASYLQECLQSVLAQRGVQLRDVELVLYDDASTDASLSIALDLEPQFTAILRRFIILGEGDNQDPNASKPFGCGGARNRACARATAPILVFQDADDVMLPQRLNRTLALLGEDGKYDVIGGAFERLPIGSTPRYEAYHARDVPCEGSFFAMSFRDAPLPMPTVACKATVWRACPFVDGPGVPEDLHFQYAAMEAGFRLFKVPGPPLVQYRFHDGMTSLTLHRRSLLRVRVQAFERLVLCKQAWKEGFSIWNAGRDGKDVFNALSKTARQLVRAWGDINPRKIGLSIKNIPVVHFSQLSAPVACCVPLDRDGREFEANLVSLKLIPGRDYVHLI